jgi:hypothetical protein
MLPPLSGDRSSRLRLEMTEREELGTSEVAGTLSPYLCLSCRSGARLRRRAGPHSGVLLACCPGVTRRGEAEIGWDTDHDNPANAVVG